MRITTVLALSGLGLALAACGSLPDPFTPYGTSKAAAKTTPSGEPTGVITFDPNVRMKTEEESWPVAWAQMQPRVPIEP